MGWSRFQFPSNGKVYPKVKLVFLFRSLKRGSFNSLQTGKCIQSHPHVADLADITTFQFPSNGKVYPKFIRSKFRHFVLEEFQFPSNGKVYPKLRWTEVPPAWRMFQFPSNGKVYPKFSIVGLAIALGFLFQFPSNGKVYPKRLLAQYQNIKRGFNSLQTGKCIQSSWFWL